jgi:hypothetical protein
MHTDDKKHRPSLTGLAALSREPKNVTAAKMEGYAATAAELLRGRQAANPYDLTANQDSSERFAGWQIGAQAAHEHFRSTEPIYKDTLSAAADRWVKEHPEKTDPKGLNPDGVPLDGGVACETGFAESANPFIRGTMDHSRWGKAWRDKAEEMYKDHVNAEMPRALGDKAERDPLKDVREAESQVLALLASLNQVAAMGLQEMTKQYADYQNTGFQRLSQKEQVEKHEEFLAQQAALQGALRWLAIGKTDIEKGFMSVVRSLYGGLPRKDEY